MAELDHLRHAMFAAGIAATKAAAEDLAGRAARDAPIETGALRGSATIDEDITAHRCTMTVKFTEPYAEIQETRLDFVHPKGGKARYLGDQVVQFSSRYEKVIAAAISRVV